MVHKIVITLPEYYPAKKLDKLYDICMKNEWECELREVKK